MFNGESFVLRKNAPTAENFIFKLTTLYPGGIRPHDLGTAPVSMVSVGAIPQDHAARAMQRISLTMF
jgi:hypothetical protein